MCGREGDEGNKYHLISPTAPAMRLAEEAVRVN